MKVCHFAHLKTGVSWQDLLKNTVFGLLSRLEQKRDSRLAVRNSIDAVMLREIFETIATCLC